MMKKDKEQWRAWCAFAVALNLLSMSAQRRCWTTRNRLRFGVGCRHTATADAWMLFPLLFVLMVFLLLLLNVSGREVCINESHLQLRYECSILRGFLNARKSLFSAIICSVHVYRILRQSDMVGSERSPWVVFLWFYGSHTSKWTQIDFRISCWSSVFCSMLHLNINYTHLYLHLTLSVNPNGLVHMRTASIIVWSWTPWTVNILQHVSPEHSYRPYSLFSAIRNAQVHYHHVQFCSAILVILMFTSPFGLLSVHHYFYKWKFTYVRNDNFPSQVVAFTKPRAADKKRKNAIMAYYCCCICCIGNMITWWYVDSGPTRDSQRRWDMHHTMLPPYRKLMCLVELMAYTPHRHTFTQKKNKIHVINATNCR